MLVPPLSYKCDHSFYGVLILSITPQDGDVDHDIDDRNNNYDGTNCETDNNDSENNNEGG